MIEQGNYRVDYYDQDGQLIGASRDDIRSLGAAVDVARQGLVVIAEEHLCAPSYQILRCVFSSLDETS